MRPTAARQRAAADDGHNRHRAAACEAGSGESSPEPLGAQRRENRVPQASPRGTYLQISESLRQKIEKRKISEDLPSEAELMRTYGVGRTTIGRALKVLKDDGVIESVQGAGWYVAGTGDRRPLVERVTDLLRAEGTAVGAPFPSERELCDRFGASRTAVRTAVAEMEGQGLIEKGPDRRRRVRVLPAGQEAP
ncbi:GntR family transcriptional regulator [Streptomyces sp. NPDC057654]|uniref:GntR family transcriptional regulator n=1 Tax=Streptomyces sp. NPDC057654 TaxID=3346196 RepID=UPI0036ACE46B